MQDTVGFSVVLISTSAIQVANFGLVRSMTADPAGVFAKGLQHVSSVVREHDGARLTYLESRHGR